MSPTIKRAALSVDALDGHHVRPVKKKGVRRKPSASHWSAIGRAGPVHESGIDGGLDLELERPVRRLRYGELFGLGDEAFGAQLSPSRASETSFSSSPSSTRGTGALALLGLIFSLARILVAVGSSETSRSTLSMSQFWRAIVPQADWT
jgi:hypothetical protein